MSEYSAKAQFTISDNESVVHTVFTHAERTPDLTVFSALRARVG